MRAWTEGAKKLAASMDSTLDSVRKGEDFALTQQAIADTNAGLNEFHKAVEAGAAPPGMQSSQNALLNAISAQQIVGAVTGGINTYVAQLDRSGIVNKQGGGDVVGAEIEELRRSASMKSGLGESIGSMVLAVIGGIIGTIIAPGAGTAAGVAGGAALGRLGSLLGIGDESEAGRLATKEAYSKLWEQQAPEAMNITALLGKYGGSADENTRAIRDSFAKAASAANEFGYSAEEGMEAIRQGALQGLGEGKSIEAAKDVFAFERGTGADRGALLELQTRAARFGDNDAVSNAWRGNQASGMAPGQFNEFLRATQRVFEDGISKGFVRGTQEIAGNLTYLSVLSGDNELYKGERGAQVLQNINAGLAGASGLENGDSMLTYQAAGHYLESMNDDQKAEFNDYLKKAGIAPEKLTEWQRRALVLEMAPEGLFKEVVNTFEAADFGNSDDVVNRIKRQFGFNDTQSIALHQMVDENGDRAATEAKKIMAEKSGAPPENDSADLSYQKQIAALKAWEAQLGQGYFGQKMDALPGKIGEAVKSALEEAGKAGITAPGGMIPAADASGITSAETGAELQKNRAEAVAAGNTKEVARIDNMMRDRATAFIERDKARLNFSDGLFSIDNSIYPGKEQADERAGKANLDYIVSSAYRSGNEKQAMQADEVVNSLSGLSPEERKRWDNENIANSLADSGNIASLLANTKTRLSMEGLFTEKGDRDASRKIYDIISPALLSGDETQVRQATTVMDAFQNMPKPEREEWDKKNIANSLADSGNIASLLAKLEELILATKENGKVTVEVAE
jgi:hypothetical protein